MFIYERHEPQNTLLYKVIKEYYPQYQLHLADEGRSLPEYIQAEFEDYLKCGLLEYGFWRIRCEECHHERIIGFSCKHRGFCPSCSAKRMIESSALLVDAVLPHKPMRQWVLSVPFSLRFLFAREPQVMNKVLGIVHRIISTYLIKQAGYNKSTARTGAVTFIQRFGSALNLNIHFHMLFLDGVYVDDPSLEEGIRFVAVSNHATEDIKKLVHKMSQRIARYLTKAGWIEADAEDCYLQNELFDEELTEHQSYSIHYRISTGHQKGKKVFTLKMNPPMEDDTQTHELLGKLSRFSLHAGVRVGANERDKLEHLCRYMSRPPIAASRLSLTPSGTISYKLKTPYSRSNTRSMATR